jgi:hypothetical protein
MDWFYGSRCQRRISNSGRRCGFSILPHSLSKDLQYLARDLAKWTCFQLDSTIGATELMPTGSHDTIHRLLITQVALGAGRLGKFRQMPFVVQRPVPRLTALSSMVTASSATLWISWGGLSTSPSGVPWRVIPALRSASRVRGASFGLVESCRDMLWLRIRYLRISSFGLPVIAKSINDLLAEVCRLNIRPVLVSRLSAIGQACVSTNHRRRFKFPPMTAQWTGNLG